ncbi:MAG: TlpA family protein disulfide reductase [Defluviitaleaceae bacterium]|nr:TlpA family protein disulfide reductase [Defluviitaleaceae bacterium]
MYKKLAILVAVLAFVVLIMAVAIGYDWLVSRTDTPDNLHGSTTTIEWGSGPAVDDTSEPTASDNIPEEVIPAPTPPPVDDLTPDFVMYDADGNQLSLSDFFGKPIVLNFWATWCPNCVDEIPYFEALYAERGDEIHIIKINLLDGQRETRDRVDRFMEDNGFTFPLFFDGGDGALEYGVRFIPMTFFINAAGEMVAHAQGAVDDAMLRNGLTMAGA